MRRLARLFSGVVAPFRRWPSRAYTPFSVRKTRSLKHLLQWRGKRRPVWAKAIRHGLVMMLFIAGGAGALFAVGKLAGFVPSSGAWQNEAALAVQPGCAPRQWKYIVIHHSASAHGSAAIFDEWHRARGWRCLGYHFVIGNGFEQGDGEIIAGPRWHRQESGAHANSAEYNDHGIGICLVGNLDEKAPTSAEWSALVFLVRELSSRCHIPPENIVGHNQIRRGGGTACPGRLFSLQALRDAIR